MQDSKRAKWTTLGTIKMYQNRTCTVQSVYGYGAIFRICLLVVIDMTAAMYQVITKPLTMELDFNWWRNENCDFWTSVAGAAERSGLIKPISTSAGVTSGILRFIVIYKYGTIEALCLILFIFIYYIYYCEW